MIILISLLCASLCGWLSQVTLFFAYLISFFFFFLPPNLMREDEHTKRLPKVRVKFFLHATGNIAAKFSYDQVITFLPTRAPPYSFAVDKEFNFVLLLLFFWLWIALYFDFASGSGGRCP